MNRIDIINALINKNKYKSYLEVGVRNGDCFYAINCNHKVGVDPDTTSAATNFLTSDVFFEKLAAGEPIYGIGEGEMPRTYDICFIDGLHASEQVIRDIKNCLAVLNPGGTIVMHDCLPHNEWVQKVPQQPEHDEWTGDTWKAYLYAKITLPLDTKIAVVDSDYGCGIIQPKTHLLLPELDLGFTPNMFDYNRDFIRYKQTQMNVISVGQFMKQFLV